MSNEKFYMTEDEARASLKCMFDRGNLIQPSGPTFGANLVDKISIDEIRRHIHPPWAIIGNDEESTIKHEGATQ